METKSHLKEYVKILKKVREVPFSWWKADKKYESLKEEYDLEWINKMETFTPSKNIDELIDLIEVKYSMDLNLYNVLLAINCEILEYLESENKEELTDIFIFCSLLYKILNHRWGYVSMSIFAEQRKDLIEIKPITYFNMDDYLPELLKWSSSIGKEAIIKKQNFNNKRKDHKKKNAKV